MVFAFVDLWVRKDKNDKAKFLLALGYSTQNWAGLANDIRRIAFNSELMVEKMGEYSEFVFHQRQGNYYNLASANKY